MKNNYTKAITERFQQAVLDVVAQNKLKGGKINSLKAFAESIGQSAQNFNKISRNGQHVGLSILEAACRKYGFNPTWLITGEGEMYRQKDVEGIVSDLEARLSRIEKIIKR